MKKLFLLTAISGLLFTANCTQAQDDKSKRPSPPVKISETLASGATVSIDYSQPSLKGRSIGTDIEPKAGQVWRAGANEATVFETNKDVTIEGKTLPAGKYALFTIDNGTEWTVIFSKKWNQWGAYSYKEADDALRVKVPAGKAAAPYEKLTYTINKAGNVSLAWGNLMVGFTVK